MARVPEDLDRELLVFVGKGGVGKTTTAALAAVHLARQGRRTLLVTIDPAQRLEDALGVPVGHRVKAVRGPLHAMMLAPEKVVRDYLLEAAPDRDLTKHPFYKYVSDYLPGLNELIAIGQLIEFRRERDFETIVLDTAPTGHALSFLTTPMKVRDLLKENLFLKWAVRGYSILQRLSRGGRALQGLVGRRDLIPDVPDIDFEALFRQLGKDMGDVHDLLQDAKATALHLVTVPERLAVEETLDLHAYLTRELGIRPASVFVNKMTPSLGDDPAALERFLKEAAARDRLDEALRAARLPAGLGTGLLDAARFHARRRAMNLGHLEALRRALPRLAMRLVPLQPTDVYGLDRLDALAQTTFAPAR
jgi:TRC40/GET3/ArsA family transport-energizing ATPase